MQRVAPGVASTPTSIPNSIASPAEHVAWAQTLSHPYNNLPRLEQDLAREVESAARLGPSALDWYEASFAALRKVARATAKADQWALLQRHVQVGEGMRPVFTAAVSALLAWLDTTAAAKLMLSYEITGTVPPSRLVRGVLPDPLPDVPLLGADAIQYVDALERDNRVHKQAALIHEETCKERELHLAGPEMDRLTCDSLWGPGNWRHIPRHVIFQGDKWRPIDDAKASRHNECAQLFEDDCPLQA